MASVSIEDRLAAVEADLARLKKKAALDDIPWWKQWTGAFLNDPYFEEAMKLGRKWRESQKPDLKKSRKKGHGHS